MSGLPDPVRDWYELLAVRRKWPPGTLAAVLDTAARYRALDEQPGPRKCYSRADAEGLAEQGTRWMWETVLGGGQVTAVKQIEVTAAGTVRRYWWEKLEDDDGFLTDQPLDPEAWQLAVIGREEFYAYWDMSPADGPGGAPPA